MKTWETDIGTFAAEIVGPEGAPIVLFLSGLRHQRTMWAKQVASLQTSYRCVLLDWPGQQGPSAEPARSCTIEKMFAAVLSIVEREGWKNINLVGFSMGGMVALLLASTLCDRRDIASLTLIGTSGTKEPGWKRYGEFLFLLICIRISGWGMLNGIAARKFYSKGYLDQDGNLVAVKRMLVECGPLRDGVLAHAVVYRKTVGDEVLRRITCPTLVMRGGRDKVRSYEESQRLCDLIPNANTEPMTSPQSGHGVCAEDPEFVTRHLREHLNAHAFSF